MQHACPRRRVNAWLLCGDCPGCAGFAGRFGARVALVATFVEKKTQEIVAGRSWVLGKITTAEYTQLLGLT
jgi:hypothetical protein